MRVPPDLGPRSIGELLDSAFVVYRRHVGYLLLLALIVSAPALIASALYAELAAEAMTNYLRVVLDQPVGASPDAAWEHIGRLLDALQDLSLVTIAQALAQSLSRGGAMAVCAILVHALLDGRPRPGIRVTLRRMLPRLPAVVLGPFVIQTSISFLACCCLPLYVAAIVLLLAQPVIAMLEVGRLESRVRESMGHGSLAAPLMRPVAYLVALPAVMVIDSTMRSVALTWNLRAVARGSMITFVLYGLGALLTGGVVGVANSFDDSGATAFWAQHYGELIVLPAYGVGTALWYFDLRVRREGLDLDSALASPRQAVA